MITPTRTVCYAMPEGTNELFVVKDIFSNGVLLELPLHHIQFYLFSEIGRFIVREEPVEQYHPLMFHTSELPDLKIEPGEIKHYPVTECAKKFFLNADCLCEGCSPNLWPRHHLFMWSLLEKDMVRYKKEPKS